MIYTVIIYIYYFALALASLWHPKASAWISGRRDWRSKIRSKWNKPAENQCVWIHCASLGEFEQGRPIIESIRKTFPRTRLVLSFFSPSGYDIRKNYSEVDLVVYLPLDTPRNARDFLELVQPDLVIFVKYEYWRNFFREVQERGIPFLQVSAIFQPHQIFFRWYGKSWQRHLQQMTAIFVQDPGSAELLSSIGIKQVLIAGDTRFDRVLSIRDQFEPLPDIERFCSGRSTLVAGSTWGPDEEGLLAVVRAFPDLALLLAPHEIQENHLQQIEELFPHAIRYSAWVKQTTFPPQVLIMDNIGMLSRLYHYATIAYVGGGFGVGIHNTLEAAVHGKPVLFGPQHQKFREAVGLMDCGGGISIKQIEDILPSIRNLLNDKEQLQKSSEAAGRYVQENSGATAMILEYIQVNRLLTS